jgi:tRNA A-37 threonylcarbamoyl transferase component Bud32
LAAMDPTDSGPLRLYGRTLAERYALLDEVASGGMGAVWRARDEVLGRSVAVKILHERLAREPDVLERFRLEAVAAARLSHPNVVRVFDTGVDDGLCFIVMELFSGETLEDRIRSGPLPPGEAAAVLRGVLQGLAHAHRQGVIHRDVKPANVLIDRSGLVKVTDFGIAKAAFATSDLTTTGDLLGTARYLAPEQVAGGTVDHRADLYAAGVVLYEALTGRPPFDGDTHIAVATQRLTTDPRPPGALRPGIPRALEAATMRALARDPEDRFQTAEEMNAALDRASPGPGTTRRAPRAEEPRPVRTSAFRSWMAVPLLLIALAALAVLGFTLAAPLFEGGPGGGSGTVEGASLERLDIQAAHDYDPHGDGEEYPEDVQAAFDGSSSTSWTTEGYEQIDLAGKDGVGLAFDLGSTEAIAAIRVETDIEGWEFEVHAGDQIEGLDETEALSSDGETTFTARGTQRIDLDEPVEARYVLVWITEAAPSEDRFRASVTEARVFAPGG